MAGRNRTILIDGSNAVHTLFGPLQGHKHMDGSEADFLRLVEDWVQQEPGVEVEAVFDGPWRLIGARASRVRVMFAERGSADALLLERARALRYFHKKVSVVTQDRELADLARGEEAKVLSPDRFWSWLMEGV